VVSQLVKLVVHDESAQRDKIMRENLDAMAQKVGDMQARMVKLEAMGDRVSGMAGLKTDELQGLSRGAPGASGGPFVPLASPSLEQLTDALHTLDDAAASQSDLLTLTESRLLESRLKSLMIPSSRPVDVPVGSGFRSDPFTHRGALHTGLDFPSDVGSPIHAAAGGVVRTAEMHPEYGLMLEIDHGNGLMTRYGHTSKILVKVGDLVKRGQVVADVGTTGRSTGPHLHYEVRIAGEAVNPIPYLQGEGSAVVPTTSARFAEASAQVSGGEGDGDE
jgi:murein DD-endopeptidase MepM/ murein hydrolase activator NlpD